MAKIHMPPTWPIWIPMASPRKHVHADRKLQHSAWRMLIPELSRIAKSPVGTGRTTFGSNQRMNFFRGLDCVERMSKSVSQQQSLDPVSPEDTLCQRAPLCTHTHTHAHSTFKLVQDKHQRTHVPVPTNILYPSQNTRTHAHMNTRTRTHTHAHTHAHARARTHARTRTRTRTRTHTHTHAHARTQLVRQLLAEHGERHGDAGEDRVDEGRADRQPVDEVVQRVSEDDHPRDRLHVRCERE